MRFARYDPALGNYDGNWAIGYNAATGNDFSISNNVGGTQYDGLFHIKQSGNVGIGTVSPGYTLTVNGTAWCTAGAWASDLRWKKNIATLNNPLEKLLRLRGVEFDWKRKEFKDKNFPVGRQIGIIAQEMEKEFPELVITDKEGYKALAYDKFTAVLLEAIKTQARQIEGLKKQIQGYSAPGTIPSDARVKKDIRPYNNGLKIIKGINPVWFKYNGKAGLPDDNKYHIGVIAQEIAKVAPYTVNSFPAKLNPEDKEPIKLLNFNADALTFDLINSVKELDSNITKLTQENQELKKGNKELKSDLENLKVRLSRLEAKVK